MDHRPVDLRSDTVTRPTEGMRAAMAAAEVGDDVYGEDPTVRALEERVAGMLGHEAALLVPSGTMGNQLGLRLCVAPGEELLCDADAHVLCYESGAAAWYGGIQTRTLLSAGAHGLRAAPDASLRSSLGPRGLLDPTLVAGQLRPATRAIEVEQTHNRGGGSVYPLETLRALRTVADDAGIGLHCDGARIWNAHVATGVPLASYGALADTLSVCLSKGLGAPVGSLTVSSAEKISRARALRRSLGGGMRQAGVLAAAGLYALEHHLDRMADDHARARRLAEGLAPYADPAATETNIVRLDLADAPLSAADLVAKAGEEGVRANATGAATVRLVTHLDVDDAGIDRALGVLRSLLGN
jgi:threonine aldolase